MWKEMVGRPENSIIGFESIFPLNIYGDNWREIWRFMEIKSILQ